MSFDEQVVPGTSMDVLNPSLWGRFRTVISPRDDREFLSKLKLIAVDDEGAVRATVECASCSAWCTSASSSAAPMAAARARSRTSAVAANSTARS